MTITTPAPTAQQRYQARQLARRIASIEETASATARGRQVAFSTIPVELEDGEGGSSTVVLPVEKALGLGASAGALAQATAAALAEAELAVAQAVADVAAVSGDVVTLRDVTLPALSGDVSAAQEAVAAAQQDVAAVQAGFVTLEGDVDAAAQAASDANAAALAAAGLAGSKGEVIYQASAPTGSRANPANLWIRTSDNRPATYDAGSSTWVPVTDKVATDAATAAGNAQTTANTATTTANAKNRVIWSTSAASGTTSGGVAYRDGDVWFRKVAASGLITGQWEFLSGSWVARTLDSQVIANLDAGKITTGTLDAARIAALSITAAQIAADAIVAAKIAAGAIVTDKLAAEAVTAAKIAVGAIIAEKIAAGAITAEKLAAGSITAEKIAADAITGKTITGGTIVGARITAGTIEGTVEVKSGGAILSDNGGNIIARVPDIYTDGARIGSQIGSEWASYLDRNAIVFRPGAGRGYTSGPATIQGSSYVLGGQRYSSLTLLGSPYGMLTVGVPSPRKGDGTFIADAVGVVSDFNEVYGGLARFTGQVTGQQFSRLSNGQPLRPRGAFNVTNRRGGGMSSNVANATWTTLPIPSGTGTATVNTLVDGNQAEYTAVIPQLVLPYSGWYFVTFSFMFTGNGSGTARTAAFSVNGLSGERQFENGNRAASGSMAPQDQSIPVSGVFYANAGDYLTPQVRHDTGGTLACRIESMGLFFITHA